MKLLSLIFAGTMLFLAAEPANADGSDLVGLTPPDVAVLNQDNVLHHLSDYHGKVIVLHVCTSWCGPCQQVAHEHADIIAELTSQIGADKFVFIDLLFENVFGFPTAQVDAQNWKSGTGTPAEVWHLGGDGAAAGMDIVNFAFNTTGVSAVPTNMVIGPDGVITFGIVGWDPRIEDGPLSNGGNLIVAEVVKATENIAQTIAIDIKPGGGDNAINLYSAGIVPVAILSGLDFDAPAEVDPSTISLAGASVKMIGKSDKFGCSSEDVNADGYIDLNCKVYTAEFMIEEGQTVAVLEAQTYAGEMLRGEDFIKIVP